MVVLGWRSRLRFDALCGVGVLWAFVYVGKRAVVLEPFVNVFVVFLGVVVAKMMLWSVLSRLALFIPFMVRDTGVGENAILLIDTVGVVAS